jgi:omega-6 fatty acid desaturase (delta-12 desaturase)
MGKSDRQELERFVAKYATPSNWLALLELSVAVVGYLCLLYLNSWPLYLVSVGFKTKLFMILHECGHRSFFASNDLNDLFGTLLNGINSWTGYSYWRSVHNDHHSHANNLDYDLSAQSVPWSVKQYKEASRWERLSYRLTYANPWSFLFVAGSYFTFVTPIVLRRHSRWYENLWIAFCYLMLWHTGRLYYDVASHWLGLSIGVLIMHAQHTFEGCPRQRSDRWDTLSVAMEGSSMLHVPAPFKYFTGGIEYHHIHHLNTRVPMYRMRQCHEAAGELSMFFVVPGRVLIVTQAHSLLM